MSASSYFGGAVAVGVVALNIIPGLVILGAAGVTMVALDEKGLFLTGKVISAAVELTSEVVREAFALYVNPFCEHVIVPLLNKIALVAKYVFNNFVPVLLYSSEWAFALTLVVLTVGFLAGQHVYNKYKSQGYIN